MGYETLRARCACDHGCLHFFHIGCVSYCGGSYVIYRVRCKRSCVKRRETHPETRREVTNRSSRRWKAAAAVTTLLSCIVFPVFTLFCWVWQIDLCPRRMHLGLSVCVSLSLSLCVSLSFSVCVSLSLSLYPCPLCTFAVRAIPIDHCVIWIPLSVLECIPLCPFLFVCVCVCVSVCFLLFCV